MSVQESGIAIAVVGMAGRFPGAPDVRAFWRNLRDGVESITVIGDDELRALGAPESLLRDPEYVRAGGVLEGIELFDAAFFGFNPREAEVLDPQQRIFLETAWEALEDAGYAPGATRETVGVYAGSSHSDYLTRHVLARPAVVETVGGFQVSLANSRDFLATRAAHKLNLCGPALNVQTGCSTGLVAVHVACQALEAGECDVALAGGVGILPTQRFGYRWTPGGIGSPDGHCRAFDARASGTVPGSGAALLVLRRLDDALAAGDTIHAVIRGTAINNDGGRKVGFTAPSVAGQAAVIQEAMAVAGVAPETVGYVEAHGSGTALGDPVEVAALTQAFGATARRQFCALGSVKTNVGHLDAAAGAAGLIKTILAVAHGEIPPTLHYTAPNPAIDFASSPFFVPDSLRPWPAGPRRAGVSSFGIGGTNAHVVIEEAPARDSAAPAPSWQLLPLSARTPAALEAATDRLAAHLRAHPHQPLADVAWTLQVGRRAFEHRRVLVARDPADAATALEARATVRVSGGIASEDGEPVAFLFPGVGNQYPGMGRGLYATEPVFRETVDRCSELLRPLLGGDLRAVLYPAGGDDGDDAPGRIDLRAMLGRDVRPDPAAEALNETATAHAALFVTEYALAQLWMARGVRPAALLGHSLGEYVAAAVAGAWPLEDALRLVAERARLLATLPPGAMLAVSLSEAEVWPLLRDGLCIAALNGPGATVVSGPAAAAEALLGELSRRGVACRPLPARHAFHSTMMEPVAARLAELVRRVPLQAPRIPLVSNVTGTWMRPGEATDPAYWTRHLCGPVRFDEGVRTLAAGGARLLLEVGPGHALGSLAAQVPAWDDAGPIVVGSLRHDYERQPDAAYLLGAVGRLWTAGVPVEWEGLHPHAHPRRVPLPTYPFERRRYWLDRVLTRPAEAPAVEEASSTDPAARVRVPVWRRAPLSPPAVPATPDTWLILADTGGIGTALAGRLEALGHAVVVAAVGDAFARTEAGAYAIRPGSADDFFALRDSLAVDGIQPRRVAHLWGLDPADGGETSFDAHARGFASLEAVAAAFGVGEAVRIVAVTEGAQDVAGDESVHSARASVIGACRALSEAHPTLSCRAVDLRRGGDGRLMDRLLAEVVSDAADVEVALRGAARWVRGDEAAPGGGQGTGFREGGAYVLSGSLEGVEALAEHLAERFHARLLFLVDPLFPAREAWYDPRPLSGSRTGRALRLLRAMEERHGAVHLLRAAADDPAAMRAALREARASLGTLHGIVHGVGPALPSVPPSAETATAGLERTERELDALRSAVADLDADFVLLRGVETAGDTALDAARGALAAAWTQGRATEAGVSWTWVAWAGDAENDDADGRAEDGSAWERVATLAGEPRLAVASRVRRTDTHGRVDGAAPAIADGTQDGGDVALHPRPDVAGDYHPPENEAEEILAGVWRELLGITRVGSRDDFFRLGGHSLLGMQLISRVREIFRVELPLRAVFEAPTIAGLAALIDEAILLELEEMSEEEALDASGGIPV